MRGRQAKRSAPKSGPEASTRVFQLSSTAVSALYAGVSPQAVIAERLATATSASVQRTGPTLADQPRQTVVERPRGGARSQAPVPVLYPTVPRRPMGRVSEQTAVEQPLRRGIMLAAANEGVWGPLGTDPTMPALIAIDGRADSYYAELMIEYPMARSRPRLQAAQPSLQRPITRGDGVPEADSLSTPAPPVLLTIEPSRRSRAKASAAQLTVFSAAEQRAERTMGGRILWSALIVLASVALGTSLLLWSQKILVG